MVSNDSGVVIGVAVVVALAHADALRLLQRLALGLQRRCDHHFGLLELLHRLVAASGHRGAQGAEEVHPSVVLVRGADEDLLQRAAGGCLHSCAPRQRRMERRHAPVVAAARRLGGGGERRPDHHRVGAADDRLRDVATGRHAAVRDDLHVHAGLVEMAHARRRAVRDRRRLRHADAQHATGGARVPGPTPTRTPAAPVRIRCNAAWYDAHPPTITGMSSSRTKRFRFNGSTVFETCSADTTVPWITSRSSSAAMIASASFSVRWGVTLAHDTTPASRICRMRARHELGLDRLAVDVLHPQRRLLGVELRDLGEEWLRILVARPQALEVEHADTAEPADLDRGVR